MASKPIVIGQERRWKLVSDGYYGEIHEIDHEYEESRRRVICGASRGRKGQRVLSGGGVAKRIVGRRWGGVRSGGEGGVDLESRTK